ncbi:origin recognition complex subunit 5 C-terminus-domain-containing protein, partial [Blyttiomyces helicus]
MSNLHMQPDSSIFDEAAQLFPGRSPQIDALRHLLAEPSIPAPPTILIMGPTATGKTSLLKHLLSTLPAQRRVWLDCQDRHTSRLLFESALNQLANVEPGVEVDSGRQLLGRARCENLADFGFWIGQVCREAEEGGEILDKAERLRDLTPNPIPFFMRLSETIKGIAIRDCPTTEEPAFFGSFIDIVLGAFYTPCRDLNELRHLIALLFPRYIEPVLAGKCTRKHGQRLMTHIRDVMKNTLNSLYLREVSSSWWEKREVQRRTVAAPR